VYYYRRTLMENGFLVHLSHNPLTLQNEIIKSMTANSLASYVLLKHGDTIYSDSLILWSYTLTIKIFNISEMFKILIDAKHAGKHSFPNLNSLLPTYQEKTLLFLIFYLIDQITFWMIMLKRTTLLFNYSLIPFLWMLLTLPLQTDYVSLPLLILLYRQHLKCLQTLLRSYSNRFGYEGLWPQLVCCASFPSIALYFRILYLLYLKIWMAIVAYPKVRMTIVWYPDVKTSIVFLSEDKE
jgi:hypothetical protein